MRGDRRNGWAVAFLCAVAVALVLIWVFVGIPYYRDPPQPPYDHPPLIGVPMIMQGCTGCSGLLFAGFGVAYILDRRERSQRR